MILNHFVHFSFICKSHHNWIAFLAKVGVIIPFESIELFGNLGWCSFLPYWMHALVAILIFLTIISWTTWHSSLRMCYWHDLQTPKLPETKHGINVKWLPLQHANGIAVIASKCTVYPCLIWPSTIRRISSALTPCISWSPRQSNMRSFKVSSFLVLRGCVSNFEIKIN